MPESFCTHCGQKRESVAKFCSSCGSPFSASESETAATTESVSVRPAIKLSKVRKFGIIASIIVNTLLALLLMLLQSVLDRYMTWGGGLSYILTLLVTVFVMQIFTLYLQTRQKSYLLILPTLVSFFSIFSTYRIHRDITLWLEYQGYQTQEAVQGDLFLLVFLIFFYIVITVLNVVFLFIRRKK